MSATRIEWCDWTWNPVTGCSPCSEGCEHCYARRMTYRLRGRCGYPADDPFKVTFHPDRLEQPLRRRKPSRIFVCSMGDLFHEDVTPCVRRIIFGRMEGAHWHTFIVLTKRPRQMLEDLTDNTLFTGHEFKNIILGVTAENQARFDERVPPLLQVPAAKRIVSIEPMLGPINCHLERWHSGVNRFCSLDGVIVGGETGPGARPMDPDWVRGVRDQCAEARVPFFFKRFGPKQGGGRVLDGRMHYEFPSMEATP